MASFEDTVSSLPGLKDLSAAGRTGLAERTIADIAAAHAWPFLLQVQQEFIWAASAATKSFANVSRIINVMWPQSGKYYRLEELSDIEFQKRIEISPSESNVRWWRDAGFDGAKVILELWAVPTASATVKMDYVVLPSVNDVNSLPFRFQSLVIDGMMAMLGNYGAKVAFRQHLLDVIAREQDLQGKRHRFGKDPVQNSRMANINNPS